MSECEQYILRLSPDQAKILTNACEFYARVRCGQWKELINYCLDFSHEEFCEARGASAEEALLSARDIVFPQLSHSFGHYYGVGTFLDADIAWDIYQVLRNTIALHKHPEGGSTVDFCPPTAFSGMPLPECDVKKDKQ